MPDHYLTAGKDVRRTMWILYAALACSTLVYVLVLYLQRHFAVIEPLETPDLTMALALGVVAVVIAGVSLVLPRQLYRQGLSSMDAEVVEAPDPNASVMFRDKTPTIRAFADPSAVRKSTLKRFFTPLILRLAMNEAVAILGVVLGMEGHSWTTVSPFFCLSWLLYAFSAPREAVIFGPVLEAFDARFE